MDELFALTAEIAADFYAGLPDRAVVPSATAAEIRAALGGPLPEEPRDPKRVVTELAAAADPGIVADAGGRYFGFVTGAAVPAALAADWLTSTWDQNTAMAVMSPAAMAAEDVAAQWLRELLGLPDDTSYAFVTGAQMANFTALASARHHVLARAGWDVEANGLTEAPRIRVVVGEHRHSTIDKALRMLGLGAPTDVIPSDDQGRMRVDELRVADEPTIVCAQAGEVNTGAFDDFEALAGTGAWVHVDGAFGLWAAVSPKLRHLVSGVERADSWATDGHKWLNVPYDCGLVFTRHPDAHRAAFAVSAAYLPPDAARDPIDWSPEASRRARAFATYAAIRSLGRSGIAELIERCCTHAQRLAAGLEELGAEILNDVVLNQVLFRFPTDDETQHALAAVQASGEAWMGGTIWDGRPAIRISVSSWQTTGADVDRTLAAYAGQLAAR
jgi:glutamate/tyrosine decarboxylase-like PLP-dependent enzyme